MQVIHITSINAIIILNIYEICKACIYCYLFFIPLSLIIRSNSFSRFYWILLLIDMPKFNKNWCKNMYALRGNTGGMLLLIIIQNDRPSASYITHVNKGIIPLCFLGRTLGKKCMLPSADTEEAYAKYRIRFFFFKNVT